MDFKKYLSDAKRRVEKEALKNLSYWETKGAQINPALTPLVCEFKKSMEGGKCLRGTLVLLGYKLSGGKDTNLLLKAAAAYEILHCALLAHDDIIDKSTMRRGRKSLYRALGGDHNGMSQAICLGDFGIFLACGILNSLPIDPDTKSKALAVFIDTCESTAFGQMLDIELPKRKTLEKDVIDVYNLKTARYSLVGPLLTGAILAGASQKMKNNLEDFGTNLGIAFQIKDDILGVFGNKKELGKSVTSDTEEGKNTILYLYALKNADNNGKNFLKHYYGKGKINNSNFMEIKRIFQNFGALEYAQNKASAYTFDAKKIIPKITPDPSMQKLLYGLSDFLTERTS